MTSKLFRGLQRNEGVYLVERGNEIEGGKKLFMRVVEKGFQGELTVL